MSQPGTALPSIAIAEAFQAVARACRDLLAASDFEAGLHAWLAAVGQSTDADCCGFYVRTQHEATGRETFLSPADWWRPGTGQSLGATFTQSVIIDPTGAEEFVDAMLGGQTLCMHTEEMTRGSPGRQLLEAQGTQTVITAPIFVEGVVWGAVGFDFVKRREASPEYLALLQTAADTLAAIIHRNRVQDQANTQRDARLQAEKDRADQGAHVASLLQQVVTGARLLTDVDSQRFENTLREWLGAFARKTTATRASVYDTVPFDQTGTPTLRVLCEWVREGVMGSVPVSFDRPHVIDPRGAEGLMQRSLAGEVVTFHIDEVTSSVRDSLEYQGNATVISVPLFKDGQQWGCVSFDYAARHDPRPEEVAVLQTAADMLAVVLKRHDAMREALAERESRLVAERDRASQLERVNATLTASMRALADSATPDAVVLQILQEMRRPCGTESAGVFRIDWEARRFTEGIVLDQERVLLGGKDLDFGENSIDDVPDVERLMACVRPTVLTLPQDEGMLAPQSMPFHRSRGYEAFVVQVLTVAGKPMWLLGLAGRDRSKLTPENLALFELISHQLKLALELKRLGEQARQFAVQRTQEAADRQREHALLQERNRIARDVHDTLAQGFTGVAMQLQAARAALSRRDIAHAERHMLAANDVARQSLAEARDSVYALRPEGLARGGVTEALRGQVSQMQSAGTLQVELDLRGLARPLPEAVEAALARIAQESLANIVKHSGATAARITLVFADDAVSLAVRDNGAGFDTTQPRTGLGITGMHERAEHLNARLLVASAPGAGTEIVFSVRA
jgi:signal transduction histidine kinase/GAF domain-containing protein